MGQEATILIVDQDPESTAILETAIRAAGLRSVVATTMAAARAALDAARPSMLLLETELPDGNGIDLLQELRQSDEDQQLPVLILTSREGDEEITRAFESGADDFLRKPVRLPEIMARIRGGLRLRESVRELAQKQHDAHVMLELTRALASSLDFRQILYTVVHRIAEVVDVDRVSFVLAPEADEAPVGYVIVATDDQSEQLASLELDLEKHPQLKEVLRTREAVTTTVAAQTEGTAASTLSLFPIVWEDRAIGVLELLSPPKPRALTEREVHFCSTVANATAVALRNARVMQSLRDHTQQITFARFEAERRLRSLKRYADLFASVVHGLAVVDVDSRIVFANPRAYDVLGYAEGEFKGRPLRELVHPGEEGALKALWSRLVNADFPGDVDISLVKKDDSTIVCSCSFAQLLDGEGAILMSFRDVTEERQTALELKQTKDFLESLIDASVDGIIAADLKGKIILFNQGAERIYGYKSEEVVGKMSVRHLYPEGQPQRIMRLLRSEQHGGPGRLGPLRVDVRDSNGELVPISLSAAIIYDDGVPGATFGIFTDLRERIQVEERLAQTQERLALSEKQALIAELAGTAAHELNQPLTSVMGYAEMLARQIPPEASEHRAVTRMLQEAERMADIVRKLGKITRYETKSYVGGQRILDLDKASTPSEGGTGQ